MVATRRLERRAEMRAGSSPVVRTREARESKELVLRTTAHLEKQICNNIS